MANKKNENQRDPSWPDWFTGQNIDEALYSQRFLENHKLVYTEKSFFSPKGQLADITPLRRVISRDIAPYIKSSVATKINNIVELLKIDAFAADFPPQTDRVNLKNGSLFLDGHFDSSMNEVVRFRLPVAYDPATPAPVLWMKYLDDLLYPEDILTLQEYIGYLLIPSNKAQRMLLMIGDGGEGKTQTGTVLKRMFGNYAKDGSVGKVSENAYARADLEHVLLMVDDDMRMEALKQTNYVKSLVTAQGRMDLERKRKQSYQGYMYARIMAFSNGSLQALYDRSGGFYRRQLILSAKPKDPNRMDDPDLAEKMCAEIPGILLWAIEGLQRLVANNYKFTESDRARANREMIKQEANNAILFMEAEDYIQLGSNASVSSKELYAVYCIWCEENGFTPIKSRSFSDFLVANAKKYGLEHTNDIYGLEGRRVWGFKGIKPLVDSGLRTRSGMQHVYPKDNPFA